MQFDHAAHGVFRGVVARGDRGLRVQVVAVDPRGTETGRGQRQHARAATVVDDGLACGQVRVEPGEAQRSRGMRAGAERQARIQAHDDGVGVVRWRLMARHDPQPAAETHRMEVLEPLALPDLVLDACHADMVGRQVERLCQLQDGGGAVRLGVENRLKHGMWPQAQFARRGFQDRVIDRVGQRHRQRAGLEAGVLGALRVATLEVDTQ